MYEKWSDLTEEEKQQARERHMKSYYRYHEERKAKNRKYYEENKEKISQKQKEAYQKKKSVKVSL